MGSDTMSDNRVNQVIKTKFGNAKIDNKGYYAITSRKEGNNRKFLHRLIFEDFYQCDLDEVFPEGALIHHVDGDKTNNNIWNLEVLSRAEHAAIHRKGVKHTEENILKMMKLQNKTGFYRVSTLKRKDCKQGFIWCYLYPLKNGKQKQLVAVNLLTLKNKVLKKGLRWDVIDEEKAVSLCKEYKYDFGEVC